MESTLYKKEKARFRGNALNYMSVYLKSGAFYSIKTLRPHWIYKILAFLAGDKPPIYLVKVRSKKISVMYDSTKEYLRDWEFNVQANQYTARKARKG